MAALPPFIGLWLSDVSEYKANFPGIHCFTLTQKSGKSSGSQFCSLQIKVLAETRHFL